MLSAFVQAEGAATARAKPVPARAFTYTAVFDPAPEGGYVVTFPALPGLVTEGETLAEARSMATDALRCYLEGHLADGLPIPIEEAASPGAVREAASVERRAGMSRRLPAVKPRQVIPALQRAGFVVRRVSGSHYRLNLPYDPTRWVVVAYYNRDLSRRPCAPSWSKPGLTVDELIDLL